MNSEQQGPVALQCFSPTNFYVLPSVFRFSLAKFARTMRITSSSLTRMWRRRSLPAAPGRGRRRPAPREAKCRTSSTGRRCGVATPTSSSNDGSISATRRRLAALKVSFKKQENTGRFRLENSRDVCQAVCSFYKPRVGCVKIGNALLEICAFDFRRKSSWSIALLCF